MHAVIALDKFKGALTAPEACQRVAEALGKRFPDVTCQQIPLTDGGDGFVDILTRSAGGELYSSPITGPTGQTITATYGVVNAQQLPESAQQFLNRSQGKIALVEMAQTSGLAALEKNERDPWRTHSRGLGELLALIARSGVRDILLGVGGSATQDLGLAALQPLGLTCFDQHGAKIEFPTPATWATLTRLEWNPVFRDLNIRLACDVDNPLLGPRGTVAVFACQKGLPESEVAALEQATQRIATLIEQQLNVSTPVKDHPGSGAAGGIGFGFQAILQSSLLSGADLIQNWFSLGQHIARADCVFTGEGKADSGTLEGKGPGMVLQLASRHGKPAVCLAGQVEPGLQSQAPSNIQFIAISPSDQPVEEAMRNTAANLEKAVEGLDPEMLQA